MNIKKLMKSDVIGIVCPSHIADPVRYERYIKVLESLGFRVKMGANVYKTTHGYIASEKERADDFNAMVCDPEVKMVFFGGGEGGNEILPFINYEKIKCNPKIYCSYSDGTSILNAIHTLTGLIVYYGQAPGNFGDLWYYDYEQFMTNFVGDLYNESFGFIKNSEWRTINGGVCEGTLIGGYSAAFALQLGGGFLNYNANKKYILILEDYIKLSSVAAISSYISHIEQHEFIKSVSGLIFGHYSDNVPEDLIKRLTRFGEKFNVPVVYCDDFGHGVNHGILPIGINAELDANKQTLLFKYENGQL